MSGIGWRQWCVALLLAAGLHALVLDAFVSTRPGTSDPGGGGVSLSLRHGADRPGAAATATAPGPAEPAAAAAPATEETGAIDTIAIPEVPNAELTVSVEPAMADRIAAERPVAKSDDPAPSPDSAVLPEPARQPTAEDQVGEAHTTSTAQPPVSVNSPEEPGSFDAVGSKGEPGLEGSESAVRGYLLLVQSEFNQRKHYPHDAYKRGAEGTVHLRFVVARSGTVLSYEIDNSSGHPELDREVEALMHRVQPLPPFPSELDRDRLELVLPVGFYLR